MGCPLPPYIKEQGGGGAADLGGGALEESYSHRELDSPPFLVGIGFRRGKEERDKEGGRRPPLLVLFGLGGGRGTRPALASSPLFHLGPVRPIKSPGGSGNPSGKPVKSHFHPNHFRYPNIGFQNINLHVSTILR